MRSILLLVFWQFGPLAGACLFADVVTLRDGGQVSGLVESGNTQEIQIKAADRSQTIDIHQVETIQFGVSSAPRPETPSPPKTAASEPAPAQPNSLILKDGTHVAGRWWSIDATDVHFLVNNQLQQYPRAGVLGVTFGAATLPQPPPNSTPPPTSAQPPASAAQPHPAPALAQPSATPPPQPPKSTRPAPGTPQPPASTQPDASTSRPPKLTRPAAGTPQPSTPTQPAVSTAASGSSRSVSKPDQIGMVYSWNGKVLTPLEQSRAAGRGSGSKEYWEIAAPQSRFRLREDSPLVFVVYLPQGVDPASYSLFPLEVVDGNRRTRSQPGRGGGLVTWPFEITKKNDASVITYVLTVKDLLPGEYSFSPSSSNDSYCFGVDPSAPGQ